MARAELSQLVVPNPDRREGAQPGNSGGEPANDVIGDKGMQGPPVTC